MDLWPIVLGDRGVHLLAIYQFPVDLHDWQKSKSEDRQVDIIFSACRPIPTNRLFKKSRIFYYANKALKERQYFGRGAIHL